MTKPLIPGGYILLSRKLIESEIWKKPPLYIKVWIYLLCRAQHNDYKNLKRGQLITSIPEIQEGCSWQIGYRKVKPSKDQVFQVIEWLRDPIGKNSRKGCAHVCEHNTKATMITTTKAMQGLLINIDNYAFYQDPKNYESNDVSTDEKVTKATSKQRQPDNINKNDKNDNNNTSTSFSSEKEERSAVDAPKNNEIIAELVDFYRNIEGIIPEKSDYSFIGRLYNEHGYDKVLEKLNELGKRIEAGFRPNKPKIYLMGMFKDKQPTSTGPPLPANPYKPLFKYKVGDS